jgi:ABC-2 type transport system permease protein
VIYAATYIIAYQRFMKSLGGDASYPEAFMEALEKFGITFDAVAFAVVGAQLFLSVLCGLAISMLIGMMIEDIKTLQAYLMPLVFIIMIPYMLSMFVDLNTLPLIAQILLYAIPFTHTFGAAANLFAQNWPLIAFGLIYQLIFVAALLTVAVRIFNSDKLFTLGQLMKRKPGAKSFSFGKLFK